MAKAQEMDKATRVKRAKKALESWEEIYGIINKEVDFDFFARENPDLVTLLWDDPFWEQINKGVLDNKVRELVIIAILTTLQAGPGIAIHAERAFKLGATKEEVMEAVYWPCYAVGKVTGVMVLESVKSAWERFAKGDKAETPEKVDKARKALESWEEIYGIINKEVDFDFYARENPDLVTLLWDDPFWAQVNKGVLDDKVRELLVIAILTTLKAGPGIAIHMERAFKLGATKEEIMEVIYWPCYAVGKVTGVMVLESVKSAWERFAK